MECSADAESVYRIPQEQFLAAIRNTCATEVSATS